MYTHYIYMSRRYENDEPMALYGAIGLVVDHTVPYYYCYYAIPYYD